MLNRPSIGLVTRVVVLVGALLAISAMLLLSTQPQDVVFAQEADPSLIEYSEITDPEATGDDFPPVQTFKSEDPEGAGVHWDVTGLDADDFEISEYGVLRFKERPDFENPTNRPRAAFDFNGDGDTDDLGEAAVAAETNMYKITLRSTEVRPPGETDRALSTELDLTIEVTNVDEEGVVTLQWLEPEVGTDIQAELTDPDGGITNANVDFTWWVSKVSGTPRPTLDSDWSEIPSGDFEEIVSGTTMPTTSHTPRGKRASDITPEPTDNVAVDEGKFLRVVAEYYDTHRDQNDPETDGDDRKKAYGMSMYLIRAERTTGETNSENGSPDFQPEKVAREVFENAEVGDNVQAPVEATDPNTLDPEDHLTYELVTFTGTNPDDPGPYAMDTDYFEIDRMTGQITVAEDLDFDMNPDEDNADGKYTVIVRATDPSGEKAEATVTITAKRANDAPKIYGLSELRVMEQDSDDTDENGEPDIPYRPMTGTINNTPDDTLDNDDGVYGDVTGNVYKASDPDAVDQATWTLEGADARLFALNKIPGPDEPRELKFKVPDPANPGIERPNYENPADANGDSVYEVTLVVTDGSGLVDRRQVTVFVDNVQELGKVTLWTGENADVPLGDDSPIVGETVTAKVDDPDRGVTIVTWQWFSSQDEDGDYAPIIGKTSATYTPTEKNAEDSVFLRARATYTDTLTEADDPETAGYDERVQKGAVGSPTPKDPPLTPTDPQEGDDRLYEAMATSGNAVKAEGPEDDGDNGGPTTPGRPDPIICDNGPFVLEVAENAETGSFVGAPMEGCSGGMGTVSYDLHPATADNRAFSVDMNLGSPGSPGFPQMVVGRASNTGTEDTDPDLDFEKKDTYSITVRARDEASPSQTSSFSVTIRLKDLNESPYFDESSRGKVAREYMEGGQNQVASYVAMDPDNKGIRWSLTGIDADDFMIEGGVLSFANVPDYEMPMDGYDRNNDGDYADAADSARDNVYEITVRATETEAVGGGPAKSAEMNVEVEVTPRNERGRVTLKWLRPEVGTPITASVTDPDAVVIPERVTGANPLNLDGDVTGTIRYSWYRSKVASPNLNPDPDNIPDEWVNLGTATNSYTPVGDEDPDTDLGTLDIGQYLLVLASYDDTDQENVNAVGISSYTVRADVANDDNGSPDFRRNERTIGVPEDLTPGGTVGRVIVDVEPDDDILTYELVRLGNDGARANIPDDDNNPNNDDVDFFEIDPETGNIKLKKMLSYEADDGRTYDTGTPPIEAGKYKFIVRATDPSNEGEDPDNHGVYRDQDEITITVEALKRNDAPKVTEGDADIEVNEANGRAKDDGEDHYFINLGFELTTGANPGLVESDTNPNLYKDDDPDDPDNPSWSLAGPDSDRFALGTPDDGIGRRLVFKQGFEPDYEKPKDDYGDNLYEVTVVVHDNDGVTGTKDVRVKVMNVKEDEKITLSPAQPYVPGEDAVVTATLDDYDGVKSYTYWQWYWTTTDTGLRFDPDDPDMLDASVTTQGMIAYATTNTYTASADPDTGDVGRFLHARVEYRDGWSVEDDPITSHDERNDDPDTDGTQETDHDSDEMLTGRTENAVQAASGGPTDPDPTDPDTTTPPDPTMQSFRTTVAENTPASGYVREPMSLVDELTYEIGGADAQFFVFADDMVERNADGDPTDSDVYADDNQQDKPGQLAVALSPNVTRLDRESDQNSYELELTGTHEDGRKDIIMVTIVVDPVNEAPDTPERLGVGLDIEGRPTVHREEGDSLEVATYRVVGADAASVTWLPLAGDDAGDFDFNNGVLTFKTAPDFEMPLDEGADNVYRVRVRAQPGEAGSQPVRREVVVIISDVDEPGTVTLDPTTPEAGNPITATLEDPDGGVANVSWQWERSDAAEGPWTGIEDATDDMYTPVEEDDGEKFLRAMVTYEDGHGGGKTAVSEPTSAVGVVPDQPGMLTLSTDMPAVGRAITATLVDADTPVADSMVWQWAKSATLEGTYAPISGAMERSYTPVEADLDTYLQVTVSYDDGHGMDKSLMKAATNAVEVPPADECLENLASLPSTVMGTWASGCDSQGQANNYARYYTFTLSEETRVAIYLTSGRDTYLYLRQGEGRTGRAEHQNNNLGRGNINSRIEETLAAGTYTVEATTYYRNGVTGDFTLDIRPVVRVQELETLTETYTTPGTWSDDFVSERQAPNYARYYRFTLETPADLRIDLTSEWDTYLYLVREDGTVVDENNNAGGNINSRIVQAGLAAGTYTVEATTYYRNPVTGNFVLNIGLTR